MTDRPQTRAEEIANAVSHGAGFVASVAVLPLVIMAAARQRDPADLAAGAVYAAALVLLYGTSTLYHAVPSTSAAKQLLRKLDHAAIYLLIAGSYTPFALGALRGPWGYSLLTAIWVLAAGGIAMKAGLGFRYPRVSTAFYCLMGWLAIVAIRPLAAAVGPAGLAWLVAGGLCYTLGVIFYTRPRMRYAHLIWHLFVLAGSACHLVAVVGYAAGPAR